MVGATAVVMKRWIRWVAAATAALWMLGAASMVWGAGERSPDEISRITREVSQGVYSPYCPGQTLAMCPSTNASYARQDIQKMAQEGMEADEIKAELLERYGEGYELVEPPFSDQATLLGGIVAGLAVAVFAVGFLARRRLTKGDDERVAASGSGDPDPKADPEGDDEDIYLDELRSEYRD